MALARPGVKVIGLVGDGSSLYAIQALWSAAQLKLPIAFLILNNGRYAALQDFAPVFGFQPDEAVPGTALPDIDFVALARAQGCSAQRVKDAASLAGVLREALAAAGPVLVDIAVA